MRRGDDPALVLVPPRGSNGVGQWRDARHNDGLSELIDAARTGSVPAFEQIYRVLAGPVAAYLRWHRVSDPDGLTNEVFAQVHRNLRSFRGDEQGFRSWVFTIAHHRTVDDRRRAARQVLVDGNGYVESSPKVARGASGDVEEEALVSLGSDRVRELLAVLSADQRSVVLLRVVADLSVEDVANILGKRPGAVKALQHRAVASLRRHLTRQQVTALE